MKILGLIPARGGSKGVPRKNIKLLGEKPLLEYTSEVALRCSYIDTLILSSDDDEIIEIAKRIGIEVPFKRPNDLAIDTAPTLPVIQHALQYYKSIGKDFDAVCLLQVTSPFRTVSFLNKAIQKFIKTNCDALISVQEVPHEYNPHWTFKENDYGNLTIATGDENIISRRQELPKAYHRDGSIYITKTKVLLEQNSLYGKNIGYIESPKESSINIDTMIDWEKAEEYINR